MSKYTLTVKLFGTESLGKRYYDVLSAQLDADLLREIHGYIRDRYLLTWREPGDLSTSEVGFRRRWIGIVDGDGLLKGKIAELEKKYREASFRLLPFAESDLVGREDTGPPAGAAT